MSNIIVKGTNWLKGLALTGTMVALAGMIAVSPAAPASAASASDATTPGSSIICVTSAIGKINVVAVDDAKGANVGGATVAVYNASGVLVPKGTTDANGNFNTYSCTGTFKVKVFANGYKEFAEVVNVGADQTSSVKAVLQPANSPRISGR